MVSPTVSIVSRSHLVVVSFAAEMQLVLYFILNNDEFNNYLTKQRCHIDCTG